MNHRTLLSPIAGLALASLVLAACCCPESVLGQARRLVATPTAQRRVSTATRAVPRTSTPTVARFTATPGSVRPTSVRTTPTATRLLPRRTPTRTPMKQAATPVVPAGWTMHTRQADGFAVALPAGWKQIDLDPETLDSVLNDLKKQNPDLGFLIEGQARQLLATGVRFWAFDLSPASLASGYGTNFNILKQPMTTRVGIDFVAQLVAGQLENVSNVVKPVKYRRADLPTGDSAVLEYRMSLKTPQGDVMLSITEYLVLTDDDMYAITFGTTAAQADKYAPTFEKVAQSFRLL